MQKTKKTVKFSKIFVLAINLVYLCRRMKKIGTYTLSILMAVLVFYGGTGINLISYCCNLCRVEGIEAVTKDKCCDIHHHQHGDKQVAYHHNNDKQDACHHCHNNPFGCRHDNELAACNDNKFVCQHDNDNQAIHHHDNDDHMTGNCCSMNRISFDWNAQNFSKQEIDFTPITLDLFSCNLSGLSSVDLKQGSNLHSYTPHGPPIVLPSDYLSILTVLLI